MPSILISRGQGVANIFPVIVIGVLLCLGAIGMILLTRGVRGRVLDNHPVCNRCQFDLIDLYPAAAACPECGGKLSMPDAIVVGNRRRQPVQAWVGGVMLAVLTLGIAYFTYARMRGNIDWQALKPLWVLRMEAAHGPPGDAESFKEINRRLNNGILSDHDVAATAQWVVAQMQDPTKSLWSHTLGEFVEQAWSRGQLQREDLDQYAQTVLARASDDVQLVVRPRVRLDDPLPFTLRGGLRIWRYSTSGMEFHQTYANLRIDDATLLAESGSTSNGFGFTGGWVTGVAPETLAVAKLTPGQHLACLNVQHEVRLGGQVLASNQRDLTCAFAVLPSEQPTVTLVPPEPHTEAIRRSLHFKRLLHRKDRLGMNALQLYYDCDTLPVDLCHRVEIHAAGQVIQLQILTIPAEAKAMSGLIGSTMYQPEVELQVQQVDVVLKPDLSRGIWSIDIDQVWGGELRFIGVPVESR